MHLFQYTVLILYLIALALIVVYSFGQLHLILTYLRNQGKRQPLPPLEGKDLPFVTLQLPIYNEQYVVDRLLDAMASLDYPRKRFEIQVLDDSTDETVRLLEQKVATLRAAGFQVDHIRRPDRSGFKAGALEYGLGLARGEYIAVFDADFLPNPSYLRAMLPYFAEEKTGLVQARWEHINQHYSLFTEVQAFHLDAHFTVEQFSRNIGGYYMNFNGTAGIWRKTCIQDAGGWQHDTLTEDLDLSYRAQLKGWKFVYVDEVGAPAELPAEMGAIKSQQYRWMKGGAEVARKLLRTLWQSDISWGKKFHGTMHLMSSSVFFLVLLLGTTSVPLLYIKHEIYLGSVDFLLLPVAFLLASFGILATLYVVSFQRRELTLKKALKRFFLHYIPFLAFSMGLSLHNSVAVVQGFLGKQTPFIRTPKLNLRQKQDDWKGNRYVSRKIPPSTFLELGLCMYFCFGIFLALWFRDFSILPFMLMEALGFGLVGVFSFRHAWAKG